MRTLKQPTESCEAADAVSVGMTEGRGRGLFAARALKAGATVLTERPLVGMQSLDNAQDVTVCRNCLGFTGDVISQLEVLAGVPRRECLERHRRRIPANGNYEAGRPGQLSGLCECLEGCGEVYCSAKCRSEHWTRSHRLLCVGPVPENGAEDHPLVAFRVHATQTNEIFLLVGEVLAHIAASFFKDPRTRTEATPDSSSSSDCNRDTESLAAARSPFADFVQEPWWDVAVPRDDASPRDLPNGGAVENAAAAAVSLPDTLRALCEESSALLRSAFALALGPLPAPLELALSAERFARVVGMFEQNNVGVRAPSPIPEVLRGLLEDGEGVVDVKRFAARGEVLREAAGLVVEIMEEDCDDDGEDEDAGGVASTCCGGGQEEGGEGDDHRHGCCTSTPGGAPSGGVEVVVEAFRKPHSAAAPARARAESTGGDEDDILAVLRSAVDDDAGDEDERGEELFAPLDGTALYSLVCCMNHSCRPNCVVRYSGRRRQRRESKESRNPDSGGGGIADPLVADVVLLEDVPAGEELTQSYVTREMGLVERRRALEDYGFLCACPRCLEEEAAAL